MAKFSEWKQRGIDHRDFQHADRLEDWEDQPYRKAGKPKRCRSESGEHDYSKLFKSYEGTWFSYRIFECTHCHKHKWK